MAVLFVPPWGEDYYRMHSLLAALARRLGERGIPSLRLDCRGVGDSRGEPSFPGWRIDVARAADELRDRCGLERFALCGFGLGAALAYQAGAEASDCPLVIMVEPVLSGIGFLQLLRNREAARRAAVRGGAARFVNDREEELCGSLIPAHFVRDVEEINLLTAASTRPAYVVLSSGPGEALDEFAIRHRVRGAAVRREEFSKGMLAAALFEIIEDEVIL
jgi:pimeloyl-ACP methyl ester carboxylesterase